MVLLLRYGSGILARLSLGKERGTDASPGSGLGEIYCAGNGLCGREVGPINESDDEE